MNPLPFDRFHIRLGVTSCLAEMAGSAKAKRTTGYAAAPTTKTQIKTDPDANQGFGLLIAMENQTIAGRTKYKSSPRNSARNRHSNTNTSKKRPYRRHIPGSDSCPEGPITKWR